MGASGGSCWFLVLGSWLVAAVGGDRGWEDGWQGFDGEMLVGGSFDLWKLETSRRKIGRMAFLCGLPACLPVAAFRDCNHCPFTA